MTHAARIAAAQHAVMLATVTRDILGAEVHAAIPDPGHGCTTAMFEAWNDRLEAEMERSGYNAASADLANARLELFNAGAAWVRSTAAAPLTLALLDRAEGGHTEARSRFTDLLMRLDTRTV